MPVEFTSVKEKLLWAIIKDIIAEHIQIQGNRAKPSLFCEREIMFGEFIGVL